MKHTPLVLIVATASLASCLEDPKLVAQYEQQKTELAKLKGEVVLLEEKLAALPEDVPAKLAAAKAKEQAQKQEIAKLEDEWKALEGQKKDLKSEVEAYRLKYSTR